MSLSRVMKKIQTKKLHLKTATIAELGRAAGAADSAIPDVCISKVIISIASAILNCVTQVNCPSDANGNCRTYTPSRSC